MRSHSISIFRAHRKKHTTKTPKTAKKKVKINLKYSSIIKQYESTNCKTEKKRIPIENNSINNNVNNNNGSVFLHSLCTISNISNYNSYNNNTKQNNKINNTIINDYLYENKSTYSTNYFSKTNQILSNNCKTITYNNNINDENSRFYSLNDLNNEYINIDLINRITKCEQLKTEILINEHRKHYSSEGKFEPITYYPKYSFIRKHPKGRNKYEPCLQYNKMSIFSKRSPVKNLFRTASPDINHHNHYSIITLNNVSNTSQQKTFLLSNRKNSHTKRKTATKLIAKIESLHKNIYYKNKKIQNEIISKTNRDHKKEEKNSFKKNLKQSDVVGNYNLSPKKNENEYVIDLEKLLRKNAKKVKFKLEKKDQKLVDQIVNQVLIEDMILHKEVTNNTEYNTKIQQINLDKIFKKVSYETIALKEKLRIEGLFNHKPQDELSKIKRLVQKFHVHTNKEEQEKHDQIRAHIFKYINPLPREILRVKAKSFRK